MPRSAPSCTGAWQKSRLYDSGFVVDCRQRQERSGAQETMTQSLRWTSADLELFPDDGKRYEIIDGDLYVSKQPSWAHQLMCFGIGVPLDGWSRETCA